MLGLGLYSMLNRVAHLFLVVFVFIPYQVIYLSQFEQLTLKIPEVSLSDLILGCPLLLLGGYLVPEGVDLLNQFSFFLL